MTGNEMIDSVKIRQEMDQMVEMISHPAFVDAMKRLKEAPVSERLNLGKELLTVEALGTAGVPMPKGMRVTTRYFESGSPDIIEISPDGSAKNVQHATFQVAPDVLLRQPLSIGGCACGGGFTFCGGAGGSR